MPAPSLVHAARKAPDARHQVYRMAKVMSERKNGPEGACTVVHLFQAGFTEAQVLAYRDPARALLQGLPLGLTTEPPGRREAEAAVEAIRELRFVRAAERFLTQRAWAAPVISERQWDDAAS
ncbi:hypothetical protein [Methylobacterium brachiatum]|uniref:hypothetical protein n=1 Tax=Methylobacterium brachiatum TaxID=269660 RepID=UPI002448BC0E|nr:hypothetical protein [Methylobacterium brachiatum]MDH2313075.1 hypothetical protein [Methylobacterium brachiatum]